MKQLNSKWAGFIKSVVNSSQYMKNQSIQIVDLKYGESLRNLLKIMI